PPRHYFKTIVAKTFVHANGDGETTDRITFRAGKQPIHFWTLCIGVGEHASAVDNLGALGVSVTSLDTGTSVEIFPAQDEPRDKKIAVFFIPPIRPKRTRTIEIRHRWPKSAALLVNKEVVDFEWRYESASSAGDGDVTLQVETHKALGDVVCLDSPVRD